MVQIVGISQKNGQRLRDTGRRVFVQPVAGLNVVLGCIRSCAARFACTKGWMAQTLEKIVRCPVLLNDHDDMLETRDLCVSDQCPGEKQSRNSKSEFHFSQIGDLRRRIGAIRDRQTSAVNSPEEVQNRCKRDFNTTARYSPRWQTSMQVVARSFRDTTRRTRIGCPERPYW